MLVMAPERRLPLLDALESCDIEVLLVGNCREARRMLETQPPVHVVVTDTALPDGDWRRVLEIVTQGSPNVEVIVRLRLGDPALWLDVLEQGCHRKLKLAAAFFQEPSRSPPTYSTRGENDRRPAWRRASPIERLRNRCQIDRG